MEAAACRGYSKPVTQAAVACRALVVDWRRDIAEVEGLFLASAGFSARVVCSGAAMLEEIRRRRPGLIVTGLMSLGEEDGSLPWLRRNLRSPKCIPVLFATAAPKELLPPEARLCRRAAYLAKPFTCRQLVALAEKLLSGPY